GLGGLGAGPAGMARMPYGRFVAANVTGGTLWGVGFTLAGYLAGNSWHRVQGVAGTAGLVFLAALVVGFVVTRLILSARRRRAVPVAAHLAVEAALEPPAEPVAEAPLERAPGGWLRRRVAVRHPL